MTTYTVTALLADVPFSAEGLMRNAIFGAVSGAVSFGVGELFEGVKSTILIITAQSAIYGVSQGAITAVQGGKFWSSFSSAALSSLLSSRFGRYGGIIKDSKVGMIAFSTVSGGAVAELTGGNFWQGAATAFYVSALNHAAHKMSSEVDIDPPAGKGKGGFVKKGSFDNSKTGLDIGDGVFGVLKSTTRFNGKWLGKNGKYYSESWGGNGSTGSRAGAFKAASNYKWAGRSIVGVSAVIGVLETYNGSQMDGGHFGYNAQSAAASSAGSMIGGYVGAEVGATIGAGIGVWFGGVGALPGAIIGGVIGGFSGGYGGSVIGEAWINYYHNK